MATLIEVYADRIIQTHQTYQPLDRRYLINLILQKVGSTPQWPTSQSSLLELAQQLVVCAQNNQRINKSWQQAQLLAELTDLYTPTPNQVNQTFWNQYQLSPQQATTNFYHLCQANGYIQEAAIKKNIAFQTPSPYGDLEITINLSKPEKDPKQIAQAKTQVSGYPHDALSFENEGYLGSEQQAPRRNHRLVRLSLGGETWGLQYSPYAYFEQHCILLSQAERLMKIDATTFSNLLAAVTILPHYFFGSNADLPIVGGSILSHDHYQGGQHQFAMQKAPVQSVISLKDFTDVTAGIVKWPVSTIRLQGTNQQRLVAAAAQILRVWQHYSDETVAVLAQTAGQNHHTITPIAYQKQGHYVLDLALRDNRTSSQYPAGIFHPHQSLHHIKRENIGLIEVMGLAILPPRLVPELQEVTKFLLQQPQQMAEYHRSWAQMIQQKYPDISAHNVQQILQQELGLVFQQVLADVGVFKQDNRGQAAFQRFIQAVNQS